MSPDVETTENHEIVKMEKNHHKTKSLWSVIKLPWWEFVLVLLLLGATITMYVLDHLGTHLLIGIVITSALFGLWLAFRPSEWAVDGLDNLMKYVGLTAYVAGVISSLASNLPEAVAAGILLVRGRAEILDPLGDAVYGQELISTAFYTTLAAAGFNAILLGIVILVGGKKKGHIEIKQETIQAESVLLRWGFVAMFLTFAIAIVEFIHKIIAEIQSGGNFGGGGYVYGELPRMAAVALVVSYIIYLVYLIIKGRQTKAIEAIGETKTKPTRSKLDKKMPDPVDRDNNIIEPIADEEDYLYRKSGKQTDNPYLVAPAMERPHVSLGASIVLVIIGISGIAGGGYLLSHAVEQVMETTSLNIGIIALIIGFSGAIPEHGVAVVAAAKGKTDVALGNILGGILQMSLLIFGVFAIIVPAPIDYFMLFQLAAIAGIIWFVKRSIGDDHKLTSFEGIMVILAQVFAFILLIIEIAGIE
jgi:Ca2+/Na+ antiporter